MYPKREVIYDPPPPPSLRARRAAYSTEPGTVRIKIISPPALTVLYSSDVLPSIENKNEASVHGQAVKFVLATRTQDRTSDEVVCPKAREKTVHTIVATKKTRFILKSLLAAFIECVVRGRRGANGGKGLTSKTTGGEPVTSKHCCVRSGVNGNLLCGRNP